MEDFVVRLPPFTPAWGLLALLQCRTEDVITSLQGQLLANDVAMEEIEVAAKNGRIYTLTGVLIPPSIVPILPHRCDETKREMKLVREMSKCSR